MKTTPKTKLGTTLASALALASAFALVASPAHAVTYWSTGNDGSSLINFNTVTAATTVIGNFTTTQTYGLAFAPDGSAYTMQGSNATLAKINLANATLTTIGGPGGFFGYALDFANDGTLYAVNVNNNQIDTINTTTGAFTLVQTMSGPASSIMDITFDTTGKLYGVGPSNNSVYLINPVTGVSTLAYTTALSGLMGIAADGAGNLIATSYSSPSQFEVINIGTGASAIVGTIGGGTFNDHGGDIILVPEPSALASLALGAFSLLGLRRSRSAAV